MPVIMGFHKFGRVEALGFWGWMSIDGIGRDGGRGFEKRASARLELGRMIVVGDIAL